jgi:hypothetical protein
VLCATLAVGCTDRKDDAANRDRPAQDAGSSSQMVTLSGCVEMAAASNQFTLSSVHLAPAGEQPSDAASTANSPITEGSYVRLSVQDTDQLSGHVGQRVSVTGTIKDSGRDTIGTSGAGKAPNEPASRTDASQAASSQHHSDKVKQEAGPIAQQSLANGTAPEIAVQRVTPTGERCNSQLRPEQRK